jgi:thiosulfate reductase cytochrome b subunit
MHPQKSSQAANILRISNTGFPLAKLTRRTWLHPRFNTKYNALQRVAYFSIPVPGFLSLVSGWAIHKPMQLYWLTATFGGYNKMRIWHLADVGFYPLCCPSCDSGFR